MNAKFGWLAIMGVICGSGVALWRQSEARERLDRELGRLRDQHRELARLREENERLALAQPSVVELARLRDDHAAIPQLRAEIDAMQSRVRTAAETLAKTSAERFAPGSKVPAGEWRNAGSATWTAALETVLWAAAGGDVDAFAGNLLLPSPGQKQAMALLDALPSAIREQFGTPEKLIAFFAIKDVPLGTAEVTETVELKSRGTPNVLAHVQLAAPDGKTKDLRLQLSWQSGSWKLVVPEGVIAKYSAMLKKPPTAAGP